ncbi:MAG: GNVR domain-containing protein [Azospirillaceae bacterium]|nr:GNVR domain-containing protein [Azospirillaceae bacterium]
MSLERVLVILRARSWIFIFALFVTLGGAAAVILLVPPRYDGIAYAIVDMSQPDAVTGQAQAPPFVHIEQGNMVDLATSQKVALDVVHRLDLARDADVVKAYQEAGVRDKIDIDNWATAELLKHLDAKFGDSDDVMAITYRSPSPEVSALIANTVLASFLDATLEMKVAPAQRAAQWYEPQVQRLRSDLDAARQKMLSFQRDAKLLDQSQGADAENTRLTAITEQLATARGQLLAAESEVRAGYIAGTNATNNRGVLDLQVRAETAANRKMQSAHADSLRELVQRLEQDRATQSDKMIELQGQRDHLAALAKDVELDQSLLDTATSRAAAARLQGQQSFVNVSVLDHAVPPLKAAFPKKPVVLGLAGGLGIAFGVFLALLAEAFDRRVRRTPDLEFATGMPVIGVLLPVSGTRRKALDPPHRGSSVGALPASEGFRP